MVKRVDKLPEGCKAFIQVYRALYGYKGVHMVLNEEDGDAFWEPWQTTYYQYPTKEEAMPDALELAHVEGLPFLNPKEE